MPVFLWTTFGPAAAFSCTWLLLVLTFASTGWIMLMTVRLACFISIFTGRASSSAPPLQRSRSWMILCFWHEKWLELAASLANQTAVTGALFPIRNPSIVIWLCCDVPTSWYSVSYTAIAWALCLLSRLFCRGSDGITCHMGSLELSNGSAVSSVHTCQQQPGSPHWLVSCI